MENEIKKYSETIDILRKECKQKDKEIRQAATFGHQLLNERIELKSQLQKMQIQLEALEQEKYSLQLNLDTQKQTVYSLSTELEIQSKTVDDLKEKLSTLEKQTILQKQRLNNLEKEKNDQERAQQDLQLENSSLKNNIKVLEKKVESLQESIGISMNETEIEDTHNVALCISKKEELEKALSEIQQELRTSKLEENRLISLVKELEEAVSERDKELSSYSVAIQREKDNSAELQCEIEVLKLSQLDPKRRGNSMFEELDDRRKLVEKEYKILSKKYETVMKNYEENKRELTSCKGHIAMLQSMTSKQHQDTYIKKLEDRLNCNKREIESLTFKLEKVMKSQVQKSSIQTPLSGDTYDYLRLMIQQAEKKAKDTENELMAALMKIKNLNDSLLESHQDLYMAGKELSTLRTENLKLVQEIKELTFKPDTELLETLKSAEMASNESSQRQNIIPSELMLTENGFVEIKAPRLSTKAMLRDNLHKLNVKQSAKQENKTLNKIKEDTENVPIVIETEKSMSQVKPNECAQQ